jgi:hypothetical protein
VNVTCLHTREYAQLVFQVGHELGHFYVDPHFSNWFVESVCTAITFLCLGTLGDKWATDPPFQSWKDYATVFRKYRKDILDQALSDVGIACCSGIPSWVYSSLSSVVAGGTFTRQHEMLCADIIAAIMSEYHVSCSAITKLGTASKVDGITDFVAWRDSVFPMERNLVAALENRFAHAFKARKK